jgi:hypothetical protein
MSVCVCGHDVCAFDYIPVQYNIIGTVSSQYTVYHSSKKARMIRCGTGVPEFTRTPSRY